MPREEGRRPIVFQPMGPNPAGELMVISGNVVVAKLQFGDGPEGWLYRIVRAAHREPSITVGQLAAELGLSNDQLAECLVALEERGVLLPAD